MTDNQVRIPSPTDHDNGFLTDLQAARKYRKAVSTEIHALGRYKGKGKRAIKLPIICGGPITAEERARREKAPDLKEELPLLPPDYRHLKIDRYPNVCCRPAGYRTTHPDAGYCYKCEAKMKTMAAKNGVKETQALKAIHDQVIQDRQFMGQHVDISPHDALMLELRRSAGTVAWFEERIKEIGTENEDTALHQFTKMGVMPSNWMALYQWERNHLVSVAATAIKAGVAERQVRLAEQHGQLLALAIGNFIRSPELGLTPQQAGAAPAIMSRILLSLPMGTGKEAMPAYTNAPNIIDAEVVDDQE